MNDLLKKIINYLPSDQHFEVDLDDVNATLYLLKKDIDQDAIESIVLWDDDDNVYGVVGEEFDDYEPIASFEDGTHFWMLDPPLKGEDLKGTGLSAVFDTGLSFAEGGGSPPLPTDNYEIGFGTSADTKQGRWQSVKSTKLQFIEQLNVHKEGPKDGHCFTQGSLLDGKRSSRSVVSNYIVVFDIDVGLTEKEITERLAEQGYEYILYSTHSHLKSTSTINRDGFFKWSKEDASKSIKLSSLKNYMIKLGRVVSIL